MQLPKFYPIWSTYLHKFIKKNFETIVFFHSSAQTRNIQG